MSRRRPGQKEEGPLQRTVRLYRPERDELVSTVILYEYMERQAAWLDDLRGLIPPESSNLAARLMEDWNKAVQEARNEYVSTERAAELTGWSAETLRRHAKAAHEDRRSLPKGWSQLMAHHTAGAWSFCLSSIPKKGT